MTVNKHLFCFYCFEYMPVIDQRYVSTSTAICETVYSKIAPRLLSEMSIDRLMDDGAGHAEAAVGLDETGCFEPMTTYLTGEWSRS